MLTAGASNTHNHHAVARLCRTSVFVGQPACWHKFFATCPTLHNTHGSTCSLTRWGRGDCFKRSHTVLSLTNAGCLHLGVICATCSKWCSGRCRSSPAACPSIMSQHNADTQPLLHPHVPQAQQQPHLGHTSTPCMRSSTRHARLCACNFDASFSWQHDNTKANPAGSTSRAAHAAYGRHMCRGDQQECCNLCLNRRYDNGTRQPHA